MLAYANSLSSDYSEQVIESGIPPYLQPYSNAARRYGPGFNALLWASPRSQEARFSAIARIEPLKDRTVLDVGAGRADLLDFLNKREMPPKQYVAIEAMPELIAVAQHKNHERATILCRDFVKDPACMDIAPDVIVFSGSLNTLAPGVFYSTLRHAFAATTHAVVFKFLCSRQLAGMPFLYWHEPAEALAFARSLTDDIALLDDYLDGDCTIALRKAVVP
jgi:SAM-dependent methyltransferase